MIRQADFSIKMNVLIIPVFGKLGLDGGNSIELRKSTLLEMIYTKKFVLN